MASELPDCWKRFGLKSRERQWGLYARFLGLLSRDGRRPTLTRPYLTVKLANGPNLTQPPPVPAFKVRFVVGSGGRLIEMLRSGWGIASPLLDIL